MLPLLRKFSAARFAVYRDNTNAIDHAHTTGQSQGDFNASSLGCGSANSRCLLTLLTTSRKPITKKEIRSPLSALLPKSGSLLAGSRTLDYCYEKLISAVVKPRIIFALQKQPVVVCILRLTDYFAFLVMQPVPQITLPPCRKARKKPSCLA